MPNSPQKKPWQANGARWGFLHDTIVDSLALITITVMLCAGVVAPSEGLPWLAMLLGARTVAKLRNGHQGPPSAPNGPSGGLSSLWPPRHK